MSEERSCGILMHITSLPSKHGIGTLGAESYKFVDFLKKAGQRYWQILPIGPTGYGDSPYQCYSAYAGNPLLIDIDMLIEEGLVSPDDQDLMIIDKKENFADYAQLFSFKNVILQKAYTRFAAEGAAEEKLAFSKFCRKNEYWLDDYALFMSLKYHFKLKMWTQWDEDIMMKKSEAVKKYSAKLSEEIKCQKFMQYIFFKQYRALKKYANKNSIKIFGDMPIYVSMDSVDVWASPELFCLDDKKRPTAVAGCPPDYFSPTGQLWGNPLYNWDKMEKDGYKWWISRIKYSSHLFDITRIDHFRGFESYYTIPAGNKTAEYGKWLKGPSNKLFEAVRAKLGDVPLIAEDLGFLTDDVRRMLKKAGYPGMNVLEFAFSADRENSSYLPHNYIENSVVYIGTHDNQTAMGWYTSLDEKTRKFVNKYLDIREGDSPAWKLITAAYMSVSRIAIIQMQDFLEIGDEGRMNIPSTVGNGNWAWRIEEGSLNKKLAKRIKKIAKLYFRTKPKLKKSKKEKEEIPVEVQEKAPAETAETVRIETERLILRNLVPEDSEAAFKWCGDPEVNKYMNYPLYTNAEDVKAWIESLDPNDMDNYILGFVLKDTGELIGSGGITYNKDSDAWNVGYNIRKDKWGNGYAAEAMEGIIEYVNKARPIKAIEGKFAVGNTNSKRVMEKLGMTFDRYGEYEKTDGSVKFKAEVYRKEY